MDLFKKVGNNFNGDLVGNQATDFRSKSLLTLGNFNIDESFLERRVLDFDDYFPTSKKSFLGGSDVGGLDKKLYFHRNHSFIPDYIKYNSAREYFKVMIEKTVFDFYGSLHIRNVIEDIKYFSITDYVYDADKNRSSLKIPANLITNDFGLVYSKDVNANMEYIKISEDKNLFSSYKKYRLMRKTIVDSKNVYVEFPIISFEGSEKTKSGNISLVLEGRVIPEITNGNFSISYHIKMNDMDIRLKNEKNLDPFQKYLLENKKEAENRYEIRFQVPSYLEDGSFEYLDQYLFWPFSDGFNIDFRNYGFNDFFTSLMEIGEIYDVFKTDNIFRRLLPDSVKDFDLSENRNLQKLVYLYGRNFDSLAGSIDDLMRVNNLSYNKNEKTSDKLIGGLVKMFGLDMTIFVDEKSFLERLFSEVETVSETKNIPSMINMMLWEKILVNAPYILKHLGTRKIVLFLLNLLGLDESLVQFDEFVYVAEKPLSKYVEIDAINEANLEETPITDKLYPKKIKENRHIYYQRVLGRDFGQNYHDVYEKVGFKLTKKNDNKKTWVYSEDKGFDRFDSGDFSGSRYKSDSRLVLNTKQVGLGLDFARKIEYSLYEMNMSYVFADMNANLIDFDRLLEDKYNDLNLIQKTTDTSYFALCPKVCDDIKFGFGITNAAGLSVIKTQKLTKRSSFKQPYPISNTYLDVQIRKPSFSDYIDIMLENFIDVSTRKTGLGYPKLINLYNKYLYEYKDETCLDSKEYTVSDMMRFMALLQVKWYDLIKQAIPTTSIVVGGETIVRNMVFDRDKYVYKRGITDGSEFLVDMSKYKEYKIGMHPSTMTAVLSGGYYEKIKFGLTNNKKNKLTVINTSLLLTKGAIEDLDVLLLWQINPPATIVNQYMLYYYDVVGGGTDLISVFNNTTNQYTLTVPNYDVEYLVQAHAITSIGEVVFLVKSNVVSILIEGGGVVIDPLITNFRILRIVGRIVTLEWTENSLAILSFTLERSIIDNLNYVEIATIPSISNNLLLRVYEFDDADTAELTTYFYRIRAYLGGTDYTPYIEVFGTTGLD